MLPGKIQPSDNGPGTYRFLVGSAVLAAQECLDAPEKFHARIEWLAALASPFLELKDHAGEWAQVQAESLVDEAGHELPPGAPIPKMARYKQVAFIMRVLRLGGVFGTKRMEEDDATSFFKQNLQERGGVEAAAAEES